MDEILVDQPTAADSEATVNAAWSPSCPKDILSQSVFLFVLDNLFTLKCFWQEPYTNAKHMFFSKSTLHKLETARKGICVLIVLNADFKSLESEFWKVPFEIAEVPQFQYFICKFSSWTMNLLP